MIKNIRRLRNINTRKTDDFWSDIKGIGKYEEISIMLDSKTAYFSCYDVNGFASVTIKSRNALRLAKTIMKYYEERK